MVGKTERPDDRTELRELSEKRIGLGNGSHRRKISALHRVEWQRLARRSTNELPGSEMHCRDWYTWRGVGQRTRYVGNDRFVGRFPGDDHESCATSGAERLAPRAGGQQPRPPCPSVRVHQQHVAIATGASMLERVVENDDGRTLRDRLANPTHAIG